MDFTDAVAVGLLRQLADKATLRGQSGRADFFAWLIWRLGPDETDTRPRCRRCGQPFKPNRMGRPRLDCFDCSPSKVVAEKSEKVQP